MLKLVALRTRPSSQWPRLTLTRVANRYVIIVSSLSNDFVPWAWDTLSPTWADWGILAGSFGWFSMWFLLFAKNFPIVAIQEIKEMIPLPRLRGGHH